MDRHGATRCRASAQRVPSSSRRSTNAIAYAFAAAGGLILGAGNADDHAFAQDLGRRRLHLGSVRRRRARPTEIPGFEHVVVASKMPQTSETAEEVDLPGHDPVDAESRRPCGRSDALPERVEANQSPRSGRAESAPDFFSGLVE